MSSTHSVMDSGITPVIHFYQTYADTKCLLTTVPGQLVSLGDAVYMQATTESTKLVCLCDAVNADNNVY